MKTFTFIDLFAGIGGFHIAMESLGGKCVFASEKDSHARKTYEHNFRRINPELFKDGMFNADIRNVDPNDLPDFDILCAGFPCQPFSQAGFKRGFNDTHDSERGNLFFNIADIIETKRPKAFFLENVRGIVNHDKGNTFHIIRNILENELGYSFHYQIVKACDYGLPQLRPRTFMIGFKGEGLLSNFQFPPKTPLKLTMSDIWGGRCSREIGFTLRVGGRGSNINDRRNWDSYVVDGAVKQLMPEQAKKMQGFPASFEFPVSKAEAMKQLGNSVAIDAVKACGQALLDHLIALSKESADMPHKKNKGEWTELYTFLKLIHDKEISLSDKTLSPHETLGKLSVDKVSTLNIQESCFLCEDDLVVVKNLEQNTEKRLNVSDFINPNVLSHLAEKIKSGSNAFNIREFEMIQDRLGISIVRGGTSGQKTDIVLDIRHPSFSKQNEGFGIKSYLGSNPTLLNASGQTNFIYEVENLTRDALDEVNSINTRTKLIDRITKIHELGGSLKFVSIERKTLQYNLSVVDSCMPELVSEMLLEYYVNNESLAKRNLRNIFRNGHTFGTDLPSLETKIKRLFLSILLGFFSGTKWDGSYLANGTVVVKENGDQLAFHIIDKQSLEDYLYEKVRFDKASTQRHRYGMLIAENDGKIYFKLNLQLRL